MSSNDFEGSFFALKFILLIKKSTDHTALKKKPHSKSFFEKQLLKNQEQANYGGQ